jgi:hypothetical protein
LFGEGFLVGLEAKVRRTIHNYVRLFVRPHRKATLITLAVIGAISVISAVVLRTEANGAIGIGLVYFTFFGLLATWGRQVWITDDYDKAAAAAAQAERVRQQAHRDRQANKIPPPSVASSYAILGLNENATDMEIKTAFRKLVKRYHPDRRSYSAAANTDKFRRVQEAYAEIRNARDL